MPQHQGRIIRGSTLFYYSFMMVTESPDRIRATQSWSSNCVPPDSLQHPADCPPRRSPLCDVRTALLVSSSCWFVQHLSMSQRNTDPFSIRISNLRCKSSGAEDYVMHDTLHLQNCKEEIPPNRSISPHSLRNRYSELARKSPGKTAVRLTSMITDRSSPGSHS